MIKYFLIAYLLTIGIALPVSSQLNTSESARKAGEKLNVGDRAGAIAILDKAIGQRKDLVEAYKMRGHIRSMTGDLDGAIADFTSVLEINPNDVKMYEQRGMFRSFKRDYDGALKDYEAAIANGLKSEKMYSAVAMVKRDLGDVAGAIASYQTALAINPNYASAHIGLSFTYERKGDVNEALLQLQDFLDRYEGKRGGKLPKLKGGEPVGEVVTIKREGKEKDGGQVFLIGSEVSGSFIANTPEEADRMQANREQLMNVSMAYFNLGRLYLQKDDLDIALENIEKGMKIKKDDVYGYKLRSQLYIKKGDLQAAINDLTFVVGSRMQAPDIHFDKGLLLVLQNKDDEAEKEFALHRLRFPAPQEAINKRIEEARKIRASPPI